MTITRRGALAGALVRRRWVSARRRLSVAADELDRAVPARRLQRHLRPADRGLRRPPAARAGGGREPRRRRRTIGGMIAARAKPDGCTLLVVNPSLTFAPIVYAELGFDLMRDFAPVSGIAQVPVALVVNPAKVEAKDFAAFLVMAPSSPPRQHRLFRPRHHPAYGDRAAAAADRHQADPRALSWWRTGAPGPGFRPDRRHLRAAQHGGFLCEVRPTARARRCGPQREPVLPDVPTFAQAA